MRLAPTLPVLGSLGLHGALILIVLLAVRRPLSLVSAHESVDAWAGSVVEVDALATPDGVPTLPSAPPADAAHEPAASVPRVQPVEPVPPAAPEPRRAARSPDAVPVQKPRPRHPPPREVAADSSAKYGASGSALALSSNNEPAKAASGAFASTDLPPGVRSLPSAFTRAIPPATGADPLWQTLPAGTQRAFVIAVRVNADGHIQDSKILGDHEGDTQPEQFTHLRERVVSLLGAGLFALQSELAAGYGVFRITITLSDRAVKEEGEPAALVERGFDPPHGAKPGRAYFTLASGRHFEARVEVLNAQRSAR